MVERRADVSQTPTHHVNLSGQGVRFEHDQPVEAGSHIELAMRLFPSRKVVVSYGQVVWCKENHSPDPQWTLAVDYEHIDEADRETIVKRIHTLQLDYLRRF